jgi:hypothetical protein
MDTIVYMDTTQAGFVYMNISKVVDLCESECMGLTDSFSLLQEKLQKLGFKIVAENGQEPDKTFFVFKPEILA